MAAIGSPSVPVYIDANGAARPCTNITPSSGGSSDTCAGVIDGTLLNDPTDASSKWTENLTPTAQKVYTVQHDCALMICEGPDDKNGTYEYFLDQACTLPIWKHHESANSDPRTESWAATIPLKKDSEIWARTADTTTGDGGPGACTITFYEYKLVAGDVKVEASKMMPDYSRLIHTDESSTVGSDASPSISYTTTEDCFAVFRCENTGHAYAAVEGIHVWGVGLGGDLGVLSSRGTCFVKAGETITMVIQDYGICYLSVFGLQPTPANLSELYMGAPDYENAINLITEGICTSSGINGWEVPEDGFLVAPMVSLSSGSDLNIWINGSTIDASTSVQIGHFSIGHDNGGIYVLRKGDKLYAAVSNGGTSVTVSGIDTGSGATRILFCPRRKIRIDASDIVASGSGGVLDGSLYTLSNGLPYKEVTDVAVNADAASLVYTVENDCGLYMEDEAYDPSGTTHSDIECNYWFDAAMTKPIFKHNQTDESFRDVDGTATRIEPNPEQYMGFQGTIAYVKAGTKIYASSNYYESKTGTNHRFRFYEYKLNMLATPIGIPDWNNGEDYTTGTEITKNGILAFSCSTTLVHCFVAINSKSNIVQSFGYGASTGAVRSSTVIPVKEGDVVYVGHMDPTYGEDVSHIDWEDDVTSFNITTVGAWWKFYPTKSANATAPSTSFDIVAMSSRSDAPSWWKVYANGWCEQGGQVAATSYYGGSSTTTGLSLNLLIPMESTGYHSSVQCTGVNGDWGNVANEILDARTTKTINVVCNDTANSPDHTNNKLIWEVKGWISGEALANIKAGKVWNPSTETWDNPS